MVLNSKSKSSLFNKLVNSDNPIYNPNLFLLNLNTFNSRWLQVRLMRKIIDCHLAIPCAYIFVIEHFGNLVHQLGSLGGSEGVNLAQEKEIPSKSPVLSSHFLYDIKCPFGIIFEGAKSAF